MYHNKSGINYEIRGDLSSNESLVFVHGSGCNRKFLRPLAKKLNDYKCYMIDLPDHGNSDRKNITTVEGYIDATAEFISDLDNVTLIGHSLGGTICLGVAAKTIPSLKRSVIISSGAKFDKFDREVYEMVKQQKINWPYMIKCLGSFHNLNVLKSALTLEIPDTFMKDFKIDIELDVEYALKDIIKPTLVMVGTKDILTIPEYSYKIKESVKKSKLVLVPGYKHMLPIADRKNVAYMIKRFIERT